MTRTPPRRPTPFRWAAAAGAGAALSVAGLAADALPGTVPTTIQVSASVNPAVTGQSMSFFATVTGSGGTPTGSVHFSITTSFGKTRNCHGGSTVKLAGGMATCVVNFGLFGRGAPYAVVATYGGDPTFAPSTSTTYTEEVAPAPSTVTVSAKTPVTTGAKATFAVGVVGDPPIKVRRTGSVGVQITGHDGSSVSCLEGSTLTLVKSGVATCMVAAGQLTSAASPYTVTATYSGDVDYQSATGTLVQGVG